MKIQRLIVAVCFLLLLSLPAIAADKSSKPKADSVKTGWNIGALRAFETRGTQTFRTF